MTRVLSFRLDEADPREAAALALIDGAQRQGYALRTIIADAILAYAQQGDTAALVSELRAALVDVKALAERVQQAPARQAEPPADDAGLADTFVAAVQRSVRPGKRLE